MDHLPERSPEAPPLDYASPPSGTDPRRKRFDVLLTTSFIVSAAAWCGSILSSAVFPGSGIMTIIFLALIVVGGAGMFATFITSLIVLRARGPDLHPGDFKRP